MNRFGALGTERLLVGATKTELVGRTWGMQSCLSVQFACLAHAWRMPCTMVGVCPSVMPGV